MGNVLIPLLFVNWLGIRKTFEYYINTVIHSSHWVPVIATQMSK